MWELLTLMMPGIYALCAILAGGLAWLVWQRISFKRKNNEYNIEPTTQRFSTFIRWISTLIFFGAAVLSLVFAGFSFQGPQCSVALTPDSGVACFKEGKAVEVVARPFQDGELVANSSKAIPAATGELGVVNTTDGISIGYGTSIIGSIDDESLAVAGYYRTQSEIIGPTYIALTDEATSGDPLVGISANTVSRISAEFNGVLVKVIEWYTGRSDVIAVRATFDETAISSDISRDTEIRIESGSFVIVFKLISLDLREREKVRATFLMLKYPR